MKEVTKNPYKVMFIKDNKIEFQTEWIMAKDGDAAIAATVAKHHDKYDEEVEILVHPFCG